MAEGTVAFWHTEEGWGAIEAPDRAGLGFVHYSHLERSQWQRALIAGERVEYEWADDFAQDGCQWRVAWVRPLTDPADDGPP